MKPFILALFAALAVGLVLTGCGQKGPLYLPGHNPNPPKPLVEPSSQAGHNKSSDRASGKAPDASSSSTTDSSDPAP